VSSTQAETLALRDGLLSLQQLPIFQSAQIIQVVTDSRALIDGLKSWCSELGNMLSPLQAEVMDLLGLDEGKFVISWTKGHSDDLGNSLADSLATQALRGSGEVHIPLELNYFQKKGKRTLLEPLDETPHFGLLQQLQLPAKVIKQIRRTAGQFRGFYGRIATNHARFRFPLGSV